MKVRFYCDSGAPSHHSCNTKIIDIKDWGYTDDEWYKLSDDEKYTVAKNWAINDGFEIGWEEL